MYKNSGFIPYLVTPLGKFDGADKKRSHTFDIDIKHLPKKSAFSYFFTRKKEFFANVKNPVDFSDLDPYIKLYPALFVDSGSVNHPVESNVSLLKVSDSVYKFPSGNNSAIGRIALYDGPLLSAPDDPKTWESTHCKKYILSKDELDYIIYA